MIVIAITRAPHSAIHEAAAVDAGQDSVVPSRGLAGVSGGSGFRAGRGSGACRGVHAAPRKRESHDYAEVPTLPAVGPIGATFSRWERANRRRRRDERGVDVHRSARPRRGRQVRLSGMELQAGGDGVAADPPGRPPRAIPGPGRRRDRHRGGAGRTDRTAPALVARVASGATRLPSCCGRTTGSDSS